MNIGVVYLLTGMQLAARLVTSIYSLRRFYDGPVTLFTTRPESHEIGQRCAADRHLRVHHVRFVERAGRDPTRSYLTKTAILQASPYRRTVFLDADTVIARPLGALFEAAAGHTITATAFCLWRTDADPLVDRIRRWLPLAGSPGDTFSLASLIDRACSHPYPGINAGVFAVDSQSDFVRRWDQLALLGQSMMTPDETALQLLLLDTPHAILGVKFNCHPYMNLPAETVHLWHFAGAVHLRDQRCTQFWLPVYDECREKDVAGIRQWSRLVPPDQAQPSGETLADPSPTELAGASYETGAAE